MAHPHNRPRLLPAAVLAGALALAGCTGGGPSAEPAATASWQPLRAEAAPTPSWQPLMAPPSPEPVAEATASALQDTLDGWLAESGLNGATAAVVSTQGVWSGAAGVDAAGTVLVPDAALALGSITKTFTAAQVMALAGAGRIDLDAPIDDYMQLPFATNGATVRQVLNMRSGFPSDPRGYLSLILAIKADLDRSWTAEQVIAYAADADAAARQGELGGEQDYNNLNFNALGELVEQVTGQPLAEVLRRDLLDPASLDRVWFQDAEQPQPPLMVAKNALLQKSVDEDGPWLPSRSYAASAGAAGAMAGDAADAARWGYLLYGGFLIDPGLVAQMTRLEQPDDFYGLGTVVYPDSVLHNGSLGSEYTILQVWPEDDLAVSVLIPSPLEEAEQWAPELTYALRDALLPG